MLILLLFLTICALLIPKYSYLRKGLVLFLKTGSLKPTPDELKHFPSRHIDIGNPLPWVEDRHYNEKQLSQNSLEYLEELKTISFLVLKEGKLFHEQYWGKFDKQYPTNSFSVAKSVLGALTGVAVTEGILDIDDELNKYLNIKYYPCISHIRIRDVLAMSSGLSWWESEGHPFSHNAKAYFGSNLKPIIRELRQKMHPGISFEYLSGNSLLLSFVLKKVSGMPLSKFTSEALWKPLGAEYEAHWLLDKPRGLEKAFCCFYATPRDLARLGQLYLNKGEWQGKRLIAESYIEESILAGPQYDRLLKKNNDRYGYHWWIAELDGHPVHYARGIAGQYIINIPHLDVVLVRTGYRREKPDKTGHPPDLFRYFKMIKELVE